MELDEIWAMGGPASTIQLDKLWSENRRNRAENAQQNSDCHQPDVVTVWVSWQPWK